MIPNGMSLDVSITCYFFYREM